MLLINPSQTRDEAEIGDSGRISETIETLQERSDEAAQCEPSGKRPIAAQSPPHFKTPINSRIPPTHENKALNELLQLCNEALLL